MAAQERRDPVASSLRDEELIDLLGRRLPDLLQRRPELEPEIFGAFLKTFARRDEVALIVKELRELRTEMVQRFERVDQRFERVDRRFERVDQRFDGVDQRFDGVDQRFEQVDEQFKSVHEQFKGVNERFKSVDEQFKEVAEQFKSVHRAIDRLGSRWGIRNESLFRQTIASILEQSFGVQVTQRTIAGEQFDVLIYDHQHILVEIAASVGRTIQERLERKRRLYEESTGVSPSRVILATASIHSHRAHVLRQSGIEVIEPEELDVS